MEKPDRFDAFEHRPQVSGNHLWLGLWLRLAIVGAAVAVGGVVAVFDPPGGVPKPTAATWLVAGAPLAWLAWHRAAERLDRVDADETTSVNGVARPGRRPVTRLPVSSGPFPR